MYLEKKFKNSVMFMNENRKLNMILKYIGNEKLTEIDEFASEVSKRYFIEFSSDKEVEVFFIDYLADIYSDYSLEEMNNIRSYTGISFKDVNAILRGLWSYEDSGMLTEEKKKNSIELLNNLSKSIEKLRCISANIKAYRGTSLNSFKDYGIMSLNDLVSLKGKYYFESGFTSTSLLRNKSFFNRKLEYHEFCNIEIEYLIPKESNDGLPLITDELSYSKDQNEFLLNKSSLLKIIEVKISSDGKKAYIKAVLIPQKMWNISFNKESQLNSSKTI